MNLVSSLGIQALMHLGEVPHPETQEPMENLDAAREMIDILVALRDKTQEGQSDEEKNVFGSLIPELQMKYSQKV